jgi:predicted SprT family Zn-dependent metalloprotease
MNHRQEFSLLVKNLMNQHGLFSSGWSYTYDTAKKRLGKCNYTHKYLSFSTSFIDINTIEVMKDTVLHEIAHALAGYQAAHGYEWQIKAKSIGAVPRTCIDDPRIIRPKGRYVFKCDCTEHYYHRSTVVGKRIQCNLCNAKGVVVKLY